MVYTPFYFLLFVFHFPFHTFAQNNIAVGSTLTATDSTKLWLSPSGDFAFGFSQIEGKNQFLLCIWYANINEHTIVWHANTTSPVPQGSTLRLDADSGLILSDPQGNKLWTPDVFEVVDHGFLNDTGKFFLVGSDSKVLWDTFAHPTDTLLPTQEMDIGTMLVSRRSEANFSDGRFYLRMRDDGNLVLSSKMVPTNSDYDADYYNSQTSDPSNSTNSGYKVIFSEKGSVSILKRNNATQELTPRSVSSVTENYLRLTLNFDGVLTLYSYPKGSAGNLSWTPLWSQPDNICRQLIGEIGSGACGYNSVCSIGSNQRPSCKCPQGYSLLDPSDQYGSCQPNYVQTCGKPANGSSGELFSIIEITDIDWPLSDYEQIYPSDKDDCRTACLNDCMCAVAIFLRNSCWKKKLPLSNGHLDSTMGATAFLKMGKGDALSPDPSRGFPEGKKDQGILILVGSVLLGSSVFVNVLLITALLFGFFFIYKKKIKEFAPTNPSVPSNLQYFSYQCLAEATNQFEQEIGRGAFGIVYKGEMPVGWGNIVAVKKLLDRVAHDTDKEFKTEVNVIGQTHHKNLVWLLGYCDEGQHRLLVYEYMKNGTLATFLFNDLKPCWRQRTKIALGIAHGLTYLHEECSTQIIHCDIKPQNILLDDYYTARISDFGLAKLLMMNQSRTNTYIRGTIGYFAPEWFRNNQVTVKVDVYSFGKLLMEIIACRRSLQGEEICGANIVALADWFIHCFQEKRMVLLVEDDAEALNDMEKVERFVMTAIWCIQEEPSSRPTMRKVSRMLEGTVEVHVPPLPYPLTSITSHASLE